MVVHCPTLGLISKNSRYAPLSPPIRGNPDKIPCEEGAAMSKDPLGDQPPALTEARDDGCSPDFMPGPGPGGYVEPGDREPIEWADAVDAAAARLSESWIVPDTADHMVDSGLADEFAATLCAYGVAPTEVSHHLLDRASDHLAERRAPADSHVTPARVPDKTPAGTE
jgi:hypothetical protein